MKKDVLKFIQKHQLLKKNATVLVGVSGGPDSMALLHFLFSIRQEWKLKLIVVSVDHQLRGEESLADMEYVRDVCKDWDIEFIGASLDVLAHKEKRRIGTELAARELRYQFFGEQMEKHQVDYLALGHHGDDQVETMLMGVTRIASSSSFAGIPVQREFSAGFIIRPFLCITKHILEAYCKEHDIEVRVDPTNYESAYTRNFFRNEIIPLLKEKNPNVHRTVQHLSETIAADEKFLRNEARKMVDNLVQFNSENKVASFDANLFKNRDYALQRRAYHLILNYLYEELPADLNYVHEESFFSLLERGEGTTQIDFPFNLKLENSYGDMTFYFAGKQDKHTYYYTLDIPGKVELPDGSTITANFVGKNIEQHSLSYSLSSGQVSLPLHIRTRKPGDRMSWKGLKGSKKLKDIFIDAKVPLSERESWPIVIDNHGEILWLIGLRKGQPKSQQNDGTMIQLYFEKGNL